MTRANAKLITLGIALLILLFSACGDVTVNGAWPNVDYSSWWWWPAPKDAVLSRTLAWQEPAEGLQRWSFDAVNGSIVISGNPDTTTALLTADLTVGADTIYDAQTGLDLLDVIVIRTAEEVYVRTDQPEYPGGRHYVVDYTLEIPSDMEVMVTQTNGHITVDGILGTVNIAALNGNVQLVDISGDILVGLSNGDVECTATLPPGGEFTLSTVNGDIDLTVPAWTSAALSAFAGNGTIDWYGLPLTDIFLTEHTLDGTLGSGAGTIDLDTENGAIRIRGY